MTKDDEISDLGRQIIEGLTEFRDALRDQVPLEEKFTVRTIALAIAPRRYDAADVQRTRKSLKLSQPLFAQLLGVSVKTVRAWEHGSKPPAPIACRFMDEINVAPDHWRSRMLEIFHSKGSEPVGF
jgi:putative transcriptional regulator